MIYFRAIVMCIAIILSVLSIAFGKSSGEQRDNPTFMNQLSDLSDRSGIFTYTGFGEKYYCAPSKYVSDEYKAGKIEMAITSGHIPGYKLTIACYQCCVGEDPMNEAGCKSLKFDNWSRGKNCECK